VLLPVVAAAEEAPLAVLMARQGDVRVARAGGKELAGQFGMRLEGGDEIRTGAESSADIVFAAGNSIHLGANSNLVVQGGRPAAAPAGGGAGNFESVQRFVKLKESRGTSSLATLRSAEAPAELVPIGPCQTKVREERPVFAWRASSEVGPVKLTVYRDNGVQWQGEVGHGASFAYPAEAPPLLPGVRYSWTVETTDPLLFPPLRSAASFFEVIGAAERGTLDAELAAAGKQELSTAGRAALRAGVLFGHGLLDDAIEATQQALHANAGDADLRAILARLYIETGRSAEAAAEYDRLLAPR